MSDTSDVVINLGDPSVHRHDWRSNGVTEGGAHTLTCACGAEGSGYGDFQAVGE